MLSIKNFFKKESKPEQPCSKLENIQKRLKKFDGDDLIYSRHFAALKAWENKVDDLAQSTQINECTSKQIKRLYVAIADRQLELFDKTPEQHQHPMYIEANLNTVKETYQKALAHKPSIEITSMIEAIDEDLQACDQTAPTRISGREKTWAEAKATVEKDLPHGKHHRVEAIIPETAEVYDITSGTELSEQEIAQLNAPALTANG